MENGVEVVLNHVEPYKIKGEPNTLTLEEELIIDTERDEIAKLGLVDIDAFTLNSEGNIYILCRKSKESHIFKFDKNGNFILFFGLSGQGPGELQAPLYIGIDNKEDVVVTDSRKRKLIIFDNEGNFKKEIPFEKSIIFVHPLENGNYLIFYQVFDLPGSDYFSQSSLSLWSSEFEELKELGRLKLLDYSKQRKRKGTVPIFCWSVSRGHVYFGNEESRYEIRVYDLEGNLFRKIRKEYKKEPIPDEYKKERMKNRRPQDREITYFPDSFPPYQGFFADETRRLFVMTYEKSNYPSGYIYDIFNSKGVFIGRKSINGFKTRGGHMWVITRQNYLYGIKEKESGYKELVVYKMRWE